MSQYKSVLLGECIICGVSVLEWDNYCCNCEERVKRWVKLFESSSVQPVQQKEETQEGIISQSTQTGVHTATVAGTQAEEVK